ncbi:MAG TPA: response regulator transcription factor [Myxococcota bacterium]|nr:response regulator transcription factor [Myxococcota bacterium]
MPATRILVVDDHPIVRLGIRQMLSADASLSICGEAESASDALRLARSAKADLAIVDLSLGQGSGLELIKALHAELPQLPVLVLSMHDEALFAERVLRAGARGYIMKHEAIAGLIGAIRQVMSGRIYVSERMAQRLLERLGSNQELAGGRLGNLTDRELEVFQLIGRGLGTAAIAVELEISIKTVETYRSNIKTKLELKDAADLIRYAVSWTEER